MLVFCGRVVVIRVSLVGCLFMCYEFSLFVWSVVYIGSFLWVCLLERNVVSFWVECVLIDARVIDSGW